MISSRLIKSNNAAAGCVDIVDAYDPFAGNGVALYQLNGNANDVSGNYNGTATSVTYGTGVFGQAGVFNGSNSKITANLNIGVTEVTISVWIKGSTNASKNQRIIDSSSSNYSGMCQAILSTTGKLGVSQGNNSSAEQFVIGNINIGDNAWHNCVIVLNGNSVKTYIDGQSDLNISTSVALGNDSSFVIGNQLTGTNGFLGSIDQVRIFNTALDPLEVEALYTEELCICGGTVDTLDILNDSSCIALYPLDGNANDLSGNYSGTVNGSVSYSVGEFDLAVASNNSSGAVISSSIPSASVKTLSFWLNISATYSDEVFIGSYTPYRPASGSPAVFVNTGSAVAVALPSIPLNQWNNIVLTINSGSLNYYLNGSFVGSYSSGINYIYWFNLLEGDTVVPNTHKLDQVRVFNRGISAGEVTTLYNETVCTPAACTSGTTNTLDILGDGSCIATYTLDGTPADLSGNYNGVQTNVTYPQGYFDLAGSFNGSSSYIAATSALSGLAATSNYSASLWFKANSFPNAYNTMIVGATSSVGYPPFIWTNGTTTRFHGYQYGDYTGTLNAGQWYHIVLVNSGTNTKGYIDGSEIALGSLTTWNQTAGNTLEIGGLSGQISTHAFNGSIDQVRIFNKALSAGEVTTLYNETPCN